MIHIFIAIILLIIMTLFFPSNTTGGDNSKVIFSLDEKIIIPSNEKIIIPSHGKIIHVNNDYYELKYRDIKYKNDISVHNEIERYNLIINIRKKLIDNLNELFIKSKKRTIEKEAENIINRIIFRFGSVVDFSQDMDDGLFLSKDALKTYSDKYFRELLNDVFIGDINKVMDLLPEFENALDCMNKFSDEKLSNELYNIQIKYTENNNIILRVKTPLNDTFIETDPIHIKKFNQLKKVNSDINKIFVLLLRYKILQSSNNQSGMPILVKEKFKEKLDVNFECFASAINRHYGGFSSLFYDIEKHFGSYGPFSNIKFMRGNFIANPPYEEYLLEDMISRINSFKSLKVMFIYGIPNWEDKNFDCPNKIKVENVKWENFAKNKIFPINMIAYRCCTQKNKEFQEIIDYWKSL